MEEKQQIINQNLDTLGHHLFDAHGHAVSVASATQTAAHLAERLRRKGDPGAAAALVQAMGGVLAEQDALDRALAAAMDHLEQLPIRLDVSAAAPA